MKYIKLFEKYKQYISNQDIEVINNCLEDILYFLYDNKIHDYEEFLDMPHPERSTIDRIIDSYIDDIRSLNELKFKLRLEISSKLELVEYLKELEESEEYERCASVLKKIKSK